MKTTPKVDEEKVNEILNQLYNGTVEKLPMEVYNITPAELESLYNYAYKMFQSGKFKEALPLFQFGYQMDPVSYKNAFAIAACRHHLKEFDQAISDYMEAIRVEPFNPTPFFHLFDCYMEKNDIDSAKVCLNQAIETAGDAKEYQELREKARLELDRLAKNNDRKQ